MSVDDALRHDIHGWLREAMGDRRGDGLMELLPPVGWADVATRQDLDMRFTALEASIDHRFTMVDARFTALEGSIDHRFTMVDARFTALEGSIDQRFTAIEGSIDLKLAAFEHKILGAIYERVGSLDDKLVAQTRTLFVGMVGLVISFVALVIRFAA